MKKEISFASLLLRVSISFMMLTHGYGKFIRLVSGETQFPDPLNIGGLPTLILAVFGEFVCSILLIIGYKTRLAAIPPAMVMLVAVFVVHWEDPWRNKEFGLLYLIGYITIFLLGPGRYSLDWRLKKS